jgi:hypothetical protein
MFFIKKDEIISSNDFIIHKGLDGNKFSILVFVIKHNRDHTLATLDSEKEQEELFKKIMQTIHNKIHYVDLTLY